MKYSDLVVAWLLELGYTHCFFVAGGNIMHLLDAVRTKMTCVPFVHEVGAGIATEVFNDARPANGPRAFALVTAGPGLTNSMTAIAGAWLESRELLLIGGQVKSTDLSQGELRQRGIQELDGVSIVKPISAVAQRIDRVHEKAEFVRWVERGRSPRKGPVFLEFCLDIQGAPVDREILEAAFDHRVSYHDTRQPSTKATGRVSEIAGLIRNARRPVLLVGGGVDRATASDVSKSLAAASIATMTTWNGIDRIDSRAPNYFGRTNHFGMRFSNILLQQSDLVVAVGTRLGIQQTGFNWQQWAPLAKVVQVDIDEAELRKGHPKVDYPICGEANSFLRELVNSNLGSHAEWIDFARMVRSRVPIDNSLNKTRKGYADPYRFVQELSSLCTEQDVVIPCSSGGAFTTMMQAFKQKIGQVMVSNHGLASMGYGLSAAIGASLAYPKRRTIGIEGDGGFTQNLQELATVSVNGLNLKMFIFSDEGYASIRMTQRHFFGGEYLGCDRKTGLGFPNWGKLFSAYEISTYNLDPENLISGEARTAFEEPGAAAFIVPLDPEQTYYPKISSRVTASGGMESAPLHLMSPDLPEDVAADVLRYLREAPAPPLVKA